MKYTVVAILVVLVVSAVLYKVNQIKTEDNADQEAGRNAQKRWKLYEEEKQKLEQSWQAFIKLSKTGQLDSIKGFATDEGIRRILEFTQADSGHISEV